MAEDLILSIDKQTVITISPGPWAKPNSYSVLLEREQKDKQYSTREYNLPMDATLVLRGSGLSAVSIQGIPENKMPRIAAQTDERFYIDGSFRLAKESTQAVEMGSTPVGLVKMSIAYNGEDRPYTIESHPELVELKGQAAQSITFMNSDLPHGVKTHRVILENGGGAIKFFNPWDENKEGKAKIFHTLSGSDSYEKGKEALATLAKSTQEAVTKELGLGKANHSHRNSHQLNDILGVPLGIKDTEIKDTSPEKINSDLLHKAFTAINQIKSSATDSSGKLFSERDGKNGRGNFKPLFETAVKLASELDKSSRFIDDKKVKEFHAVLDELITTATDIEKNAERENNKAPGKALRKAVQRIKVDLGQSEKLKDPDFKKPDDLDGTKQQAEIDPNSKTQQAIKTQINTLKTITQSRKPIAEQPEFKATIQQLSDAADGLVKEGKIDAEKLTVLHNAFKLLRAESDKLPTEKKTKAGADAVNPTNMLFKSIISNIETEINKNKETKMGALPAIPHAVLAAAKAAVAPELMLAVSESNQRLKTPDAVRGGGLSTPDIGRT